MEEIIGQRCFHIGDGEAYRPLLGQIEQLVVEVVQGIAAELLDEVRLPACFGDDALDGVGIVVEREVRGGEVISRQASSCGR